MAPTFGYWKIRGRGQAIRLFLEYLGQDYNECNYDKTDVPKWLTQDKKDLGLAFPNLPYYIDGDFKLTESLAILRYLADTNDLLGADAKERALVTMLEGVGVEIRMNIAKIAYSSDIDKEKAEFLQKIPIVLNNLSNHMEGKKFLVKDKPRHIDFILYEALTVLQYLDPKSLASYPKLVQFQKDIEALPRIKAYIDSPRFIKWPLHAWFAAFGGGDEPPAN